MTSLRVQCTLAAVIAAGVGATMSMAEDTRPGIGAQIEALGLDRAEVRAKLEGLSRDERITYLQTLGVRLPESLTRPGLPLTPDAAVKTAPVAEVAATPLPGADGKFTILPWPHAVDVGNEAPLTMRPGSVSNSGTVVIDPPAVGGAAGSTAPSLPAKQ